MKSVDGEQGVGGTTAASKPIFQRWRNQRSSYGCINYGGHELSGGMTDQLTCPLPQPVSAYRYLASQLWSLTLDGSVTTHIMWVVTLPAAGDQQQIQAAIHDRTRLPSTARLAAPSKDPDMSHPLRLFVRRTVITFTTETEKKNRIFSFSLKTD